MPVEESALTPDTIPHSELLQCVARRIVDGEILRLIKMWLTVPVFALAQGSGMRRGINDYRREGSPLLFGGESVEVECGTHQGESGRLLVPGNVGTWPEVRDRLNQKLR